MKKKTHNLRLVLEDESRLMTVAAFSASLRKWGLTVVVIFLSMLMLCCAIVCLTPIRRMLPGYMRESERAATELSLFRLDSLRTAADADARYIANMLSVLGSSGPITDKTSISSIKVALNPDSLIPTSVEELRFSDMMREKEKYSISVIAPLAAESLMFSSPCKGGIITSSSMDSNKTEFILPRHEPVASIADGTVIAVSQTFREGGSAVIIQHPKGFLSRLSHLGNVIVAPGDRVTGGQIIALQNKSNALKGEKIFLEIWYDGNPVIPASYIGEPAKSVSYPVIDKEVGRGRL